jgi:hypothetical protein
LGFCDGSLTWIDRQGDSWWATFAHYTVKVNDDSWARDARWTSLIKLDPEWRTVAGWAFPAAVVDRFEPHSCSGGGWGPDGKLNCTGHDRRELYRMELPRAGSTLRLLQTIPLGIAGQGIAWDRSRRGILYGIDRTKRQVFVSKLIDGGEEANREVLP